MNSKPAVRPGDEPSTSFESRIAGVALATAVAVLIAACLAFIAEQWRAERNVQAKTYAAIGQMIAADAADSIASRDLGNAQRLFDSLAHMTGVSTADLLDSRGRVVASYQRPAKKNPQTTDVDVQSTPVTAAGVRVGEVVLRTDRYRLASLLPRYIAVGAALFFIAAGLALFMGRLLASRVTRPVQRLSQAMQDISGGKGDYDTRVEPMYDDEVGQLTTSFNELLGRLKINDLTLRRTMNELVDARDAAEAANVLKSHFLANMSHEIRTPLNGVLAMAQIMAMGDMAPVQRERLDVIRKSGEALLAVLNDILDLSKIEAGRMELEMAPFEAASTLRQAFAGFTALAERKGLSYALEIDPMAEGWRAGDGARVAQIANNLISNAIKFTDKGEVLVRLEGEGADGVRGLKLSVIDTGLGIATDKQAFLFEKFSQVDSSSTRKFGGTGLGLAICRELAQVMGGSIEVESGIGQGASFIVRLPLIRVAGEVDIPSVGRIEAESDEDEPPLRVLAAEDNPTNQLVLRTVMETFGADLELVGDGVQAVEAWKRGNFDIILMDIQMPEMDGLTATRLIRDAEIELGRPRTPVIAVSANAMTHQVKEYLAAGMDGHVAKPIELAKLHAAMSNALSASEPQAPQAADSAAA